MTDVRIGFLVTSMELAETLNALEDRQKWLMGIRRFPEPVPASELGERIRALGHVAFKLGQHSFEELRKEEWTSHMTISDVLQSLRVLCNNLESGEAYGAKDLRIVLDRIAGCYERHCEARERRE